MGGCSRSRKVMFSVEEGKTRKKKNIKKKKKEKEGESGVGLVGKVKLRIPR